MYHFVALLWNADDAGANEEATQLRQQLQRSSAAWENPLSTDGLCVFTLTPSDPALRSYVLPGEAGVVLGKLFSANLSNGSFNSIDQIDAHTTGQIIATGGQHLVRHFWGGYVALLTDRATQGYVLRDCSGKVPCYHLRYRDVTVAFADVNDLAALELPAPTVNWEYLAAFIYSSQAQVRASGFKDLNELLPGDSLKIQGRASSQTALWDPRAIYRERRVDRYDDAVAELRELTQQCIDAWARSYDPLLLGLSGGFDSAVVLGCLSRSPHRPAMTCMNQYTTAAYEDEREYARAAANRSGVRLLELPMTSAADRFDSRLLGIPKTAKPGVTALFRALELDLVNRLAGEVGARILWTGQGGDHIFLQTTDPFSAGDYLEHKGLRPGFAGAVRDAAHLSRQPYWFVLKTAWGKRRGVEKPSGEPPARTTPFVNPEALPQSVDQYVLHPWILDAADLPRGKLMQMRFLSEVANRHRPIPRLERAPQHHPLLSQPLMELCLQIPTYHLIRGGRERALAREAFADRVPLEILRRRDKGSIVTHATEMIRHSEPFVRELLLDGLLANNGVLVAADLEPYIVDGQPLREELLMPLLACIAAEVWARAAVQGSTSA